MDTPMHPASTTPPDVSLAPDAIGIKATDVTVTYRNGHTALVDASFAIPTGSITAQRSWFSITIQVCGSGTQGNLHKRARITF